MKKLKIDLSMIEAAMEDAERYYNKYFLDRDTGEVIILTEEVTGYTKEQELRDDLSEWMLNELKIAKEILIDNPERYINIPMKPVYESYNLMVEFADSVTDELLREKLNITLVGKGAFHRFKMVLSDYPFYKQKWFQLKEQRLKIEILDWLRSIGIEVIE